MFEVGSLFAQEGFIVHTFDLSGTGLSGPITMNDPLEHLFSDITVILKKVD
jgi:alpha-beta hydrolase superfamily lysophospholipase